MTSICRHHILGDVEVVVNARACRFIARWSSGHVRLTVPPGTAERQIMLTLDGMAPRLMASRPRHYRFAEGQTIDCGEMQIVIGRQSHRPSGVITTPRLPVTYIEAGRSLDLESPEVAREISRIVCRVAEALAPRLLLPRARALAAELRLHPTGWRIGSGRRVLGSCTSKGIITLSYMMVFLSQELRDFVVWHELAHLREMNHSPRFHELLGRYCGGREASLRSALRKFAWPVDRG